MQQKITIVFLCFLLFCWLAFAEGGPAQEIKIGSYRADVFNGITFIHHDQAAFVLRVGWVDFGAYHRGLDDLLKIIERFGPAAPKSAGMSMS